MAHDEFWGDRAGTTLYWWHSERKAWLKRENGDWKGWGLHTQDRVTLEGSWTPWTRVQRTAATSEHVVHWFAGGATNIVVTEVDCHVLQHGCSAAFVEDNSTTPTTTLSDVWACSTAAASVLSSRLDAGCRLGMYLPNSAPAVIWAIGAARAAFPYVPVAVGSTALVLSGRLADAGASLLLVEATDRVQWPAAYTSPPELEVGAGSAVGERVTGMPRGHATLWDTFAPRPVDASYPLLILYTSGSTGKSKGVVHVHGGYAVGLVATNDTVLDLRPGRNDVFFVIATPGWITGQSYMIATALLSRVPSILVEGSPVSPPDRFASIIERHKVTVLKAGSTFLRAFMLLPDCQDVLSRRDTASLRLGTFCAEPVNEPVHRFAITHLTSRYINSYWATEHGGLVWSRPHEDSHLPPLRPSAESWPLPWIAGDVVVEDGGGWRAALPGERGDVAIRQRYPYQALTVWCAKDFGTPKWVGDAERWGRYFEAGCYLQGDFAVRHSSGAYTFHGRSDEVLNVGGNRVGTGEIETALLRAWHSEFEEPVVRNCAVVGCSDTILGTTAVAFVVPANVTTWTRRDGARAKTAAAALVAREVGDHAVPSRFVCVEELPETYTGKIVRRLLSNACNCEPFGDTSSVRNPASVAALANAVAAADQAGGKMSPVATADPNLAECIRDAVRCALGGNACIADDAPLMEAGMTSIRSFHLRNALQDIVGETLPVTLMFDHPTTRSLYTALAGGRGVVDAAVAREQQVAGGSPALVAVDHRAIPGGGGAQDAHAVVRAGADCVGQIPIARWSLYEHVAAPYRSGGFVPQVHRFDAHAFGMTVAEAHAVDPQQCALLSTAYSTVHSAKPVFEAACGDVAVCVGTERADWTFRLAVGATSPSHITPPPFAAVAEAPSIASGRISFHFGWTGSSTSVDTACSASLVALCHAATEVCRAGVTGAALVATSALKLAPHLTLAFATAGMLSVSGRCFTFDASANGYVRSEAVMSAGVGAADTKTTRPTAPLVESAVGQDGRSASLTAPNGVSQAVLMQRAGGRVARVEAHGTGTLLGDPIESGSITRALGREVAPGAWKSSLGHTEAASGLCGLVRTLGAARPVLARLRVLSPHVEPCLSYFVQSIATSQDDLEGVSSFGYSGTLAHVRVRAPQTPFGQAGRPVRKGVRLRCFTQGYRRAAVQGGRFHRARRRLYDARHRPWAVAVAKLPVRLHEDVTVVGAGLTGLTIGDEFVRAGVAPLLLDKAAHAGGVWVAHGNAHSRVNSSEPAYRLRVESRAHDNTDHSPCHEILEDAFALLSQGSLRLCLHTHVRSVDATDTGWAVRAVRLHCGTPTTVSATVVAVCTNRRLGAPRELSIAGERGVYRGQVRRGLAGDAADVAFQNTRVVLIGMGAYALENLRTALERSAAHVMVACRQRGTVCPQILDWVNFARRRDARGRHDASGSAYIFELWQQIYDLSGAARPDVWKAGMLKPDGHTVSVSDLFFVGHHFGMAATKVCTVERLREEAAMVRDASSGREWVPCDVLIKCVGFELQGSNAELVGAEYMRGFGLVARNLWVQVEPHLDEAFFRSPFGSSYLAMAQFTAKLSVLCWQDPTIAPRLLAAVPANAPVNGVTSAHFNDALGAAADAVPEVAELLCAEVERVRSDFERSLAFDRYVEENARFWAQVHALLRPRASCNSDSQLPYIFYPLRELVSHGTAAPLAPGCSATLACPVVSVNSVDVASVACVAETLIGDAVDPDAPLMDAGLDSISAVELRHRLAELTGTSVSVTLLFDAPTVRSIAATLGGRKRGPVCATAPTQRSAAGHTQLHAMSSRLPGNADARRASAAAASLRDLAECRWELTEPTHVRYGGFLHDAQLFDAAAFGMSPAEALAVDPQQRHLLETGYAALGAARWVRGGNAEVGVFVGLEYYDFDEVVRTTPALREGILSVNSGAMAAGRTSFVLDLRGPCALIGATCATGLVALHAATSSPPPMSLVAATSLMLHPAWHLWHARAGSLSPDGTCKTFDAAANGFARSESVFAAVVGNNARSAAIAELTALRVHSDGRSASFTAPNGMAQRELLHAALRDAANAVCQYEAHGTGTPLGDPVEMASAADMRVALNSGAKAGMGHAEPAAGLLGLTCLALAIREGVGWANARLRVLNPHVAAHAAFPLCVARHACDGAYHGGVSSFGINGTIAHACITCPAPTAVALRRAVAYRRRRYAWWARETVSTMDYMAVRWVKVAATHRRCEGVVVLPPCDTAALEFVARKVLATDTAHSRLCVVTRDAQLRGCNVDHGAVWGLARTCRMEGHAVAIVDLPTGCDLPGLVDGAEDECIISSMGEQRVPRLQRAEVNRQVVNAFPSRVVLTGGLGGLGGALVRSFSGSTTFHIASRTTWCDVACRRDVAALWTRVCPDPDHPPAVMHAAGVTKDGRLEKVVWREDVAAVFAPKVHGALHLHAVGAQVVLCSTILFSSSAAAFGAAGAAVYASANSALDSLAIWTRTSGRPATALQLPPVQEVGLGAATFGASALQRMGALTLEQFLDAAGRASSYAGPVSPLTLRFLEYARNSPAPPAPSTTPANALTEDEAQSALQTVLTELLGERRVDADTPLMDAGVDSLLATELVRGLRAATGVQTISPTLLFEHTTRRAIVAHLAEATSPKIRQVKGDARHQDNVVGMCAGGGAWPGGCRQSLTRVALFSAAGDAVTLVPAQRWQREDHGAAAHGGFLQDAHCFDSLAFAVTLVEANAMDPQHRLLLETNYTRLHGSGFRRSAGATPTNVVVGIERPDWLLLPHQQTAYSATADNVSVAAGRTSYVLDLRGCCSAVDAACASGLVCTHFGMLVTKACQNTLCSAVSLKLSPGPSMLVSNAGMTCPDGRCKTFDRRANGYARAEGVTSILLGHESIAWSVAVCVRQDGRSASLTAPNGNAQRDLIHAVAGTRDAVRSVECHGTGTALGDPTEAAALAAVYVTPICAAAKANVGHAEACAGLFGIMAAALDPMRGHGLAHLRVLNPHLLQSPSFAATALSLHGPAQIPSVTSSFGYSGVIGHAALVGEHPTAPAQLGRRAHFRRSIFAWVEPQVTTRHVLRLFKRCGMGKADLQFLKMLPVEEVVQVLRSVPGMNLDAQVMQWCVRAILG